MFKIKITSQESNQRVDKYVRKLLNDAPLSFLYKLFRKKDVKINSHWVKIDYVLKENDELTIYVNDSQLEEFNKPKEVIKQKFTHEIIYEDNNILLVNKPKGLLVHGDISEKRITLSNQVLSYLYDKNEYDLGKSIYHLLGCYYLQEPSAMLPAYLNNCNDNDIVLDLCAAPGGKSVQSAFNMHNNGVIISNDLSKQRALAIVENAERLGLRNLIVTNNDFSLINNYYQDIFTKIILDAPCSGSGMFRKSQEVKDDWTYDKVLKCAEIQKNLVIYAYNMLKPGGIMCYSTCSFSLEEDENIIEYLLKETDAELIEIENNALFYKNSKKPFGIHLFPSKFPGEGHYVCLIKKPGESTKRLETNKTIRTKFYGSRNKKNCAIAVFKAIKNIHFPEEFNDFKIHLNYTIKYPKSQENS